MNPGKLDRRISIYVRTVTRDDTGTRVEKWTEQEKVWAEMMQDKGSKSEVADTEQPRQIRKWRIRYREIDSANHRIIYGGKTYQITGTEQTGGREGYLIVESYALV
jgi:SPP1 family predicted phage head-tail adaptor